MAGISACAARAGEDDVLAAVLVATWSLTSGRTLPPGVRPDELTEEELLWFWADDLAPRSGPAPARRPVTAGEAR
jgi:hypothetical protein